MVMNMYKSKISYGIGSMNKYIVMVLATIIAVQSTHAQSLKMIRSAKILDVENSRLITGQAILIKDDRIIEIGTEQDIRKNYTSSITVEVIDMTGLTIMPGLIDAHSHILLHPYNETSWNDQVIKESRAERTARAVIHLKNTLNAGFTSLRDLGSEGAGYADVGLKVALEKQIIEGPTIIVAGRAIVATGSYGPKGFDLSHEITLGAEPADGGTLIKVVRDHIGKGADIVKIYADYRWGPNGEAMPTFSLDEIKMIVETAASSGRSVVAHSATVEGMRRSILAGVQSIEHGDEGTAEIFDLMKQHGVIYCPTITVTEALAEYGGWKKGIEQDTKSIARKRAAMTSAIKSGVTICNGSDVGPYTHGDNLRELKLMNEYGLSIEKTLQAATMVGGELMGKKEELGQIKKGYIADLIAVEGNPLQDLNVLNNIKVIIQRGNIYKPQ
jgi:imidazolonepropionase-like amidohydrolase